MQESTSTGGAGAPNSAAPQPPPSLAAVGHMSPEDFRRHGHALIDFIADYLCPGGGAERARVLAGVEPGEVLAGLPPAAPEQAEPFERVLAEAIDPAGPIMRGITHWQSPWFAAYFSANASYPAILGELLSAGLGVNGMLWLSSPSCTELEMRVLDWMAAALGLPREFRFADAGGVGGGVGGGGGGGGVIQGTASEATLVALLAARQRGRQRGNADDTHTLYTSSQAHSSVVKAAMIAGLAAGPDDRRRVRLIGTDGRHAMDVGGGGLRAAMERDRAAGLRPCFVAATIGTTSSGAVDPLGAIGTLAGEHGAWLHADAAWAGSAMLCPEHRAELEHAGLAACDSICINPHKWLLTNFDCDLLWVRDRATLTAALSVTPEYLRNTASQGGGVVDYRDWQVPLGRRFRALKLWFVLRHYGLGRLRTYIRRHVALAGLFESLARADERFEVACPRSLSLVCLRLRARAGESAERTSARTRALHEAITARGRLFVSHTVLPATGEGLAAGEGRYVIRYCANAPNVEEAHVRGAWAEVVEALEALEGRA